MIKRLSDGFGISGYEKEISDMITSKLSEYDLYPDKDAIGNLFVYTQKSSTSQIIITAHMDEPGFIITDITADGYLKFELIGNIEPKYLLSQRVKIGEIGGIISFKAIHLISKDEREKPIKSDDLLIDIGADTQKEAEKAVCIGDYGLFDSEFEEFGQNSITSKALGARSGCFALIEFLKRAKELNLNILGIFTVQHEISFRGAEVAFTNLPKSNITVVIDSVECNDVIKIGNGVVVGFFKGMGKISNDISNRICRLAEKNSIKCQNAAITHRSEVDILSSKMSNITHIYLGIPCKYKKNPVNNIVNNEDIKYLLSLIEEIAKGAENGTII